MIIKCLQYLVIFCSQTSWRLTDGAIPTREKLMHILISVDALLVKASHYTSFKSATLHSFIMDTAIGKYVAVTTLLPYTN